jgi:hypothetical protein
LDQHKSIIANSYAAFEPEIAGFIQEHRHMGRSRGYGFRHKIVADFECLFS